MATIFKPRIEVLAELKLHTYAVIKNYVENEHYVLGIIKYEEKNKFDRIGFKYDILLDKLTLLTINEMTTSAYFIMCKE